MLYLVSFQPTVELAMANQDLAPHANGPQRVDGPVDPLPQCPFRDTSVFLECLEV
jgi:hypothetical protein